MLTTIDSVSIEADRRQTLARVAALEDRMQAEIDLAIKAEEAAYKTLAEIIDSEPTVIEVYVPALHCKIRMQPLTVEDYIKGLKYREERNEEGCIKFFVHMIKSTWGKCDPTVTEERLRKMGLRTLVKIMRAIPIPKMDITQDPLSKKQSSLPPVLSRAGRTS